MKRRWCVAGLLVLLVSGAAWSGQKKRQPKGQPAEQASLPPMPMSEEQTINQRIAEMLAAWQIGDAEMMHKYYADDVTVVSGLYQPVLAGWPAYLQAYQQQQQRMREVQIIRRNTYVRVAGNVAWASYQWQFGGLVDGKSAMARGHTTLVFEKRSGNWLIVHNHTSEVCEVPPSPASPKSGS